MPKCGGHWKYLNNEFEHDPQMVSANYVGDLVIPNVQAAIRYALYRQECSGLGNFGGGMF